MNDSATTTAPPQADAQPILVAEALQPLPWNNQAFWPSISLRVQPGHTVCLMGPNTRQRTAYLRALAGVDPPTRGELWFDNRAITHVDRRTWRRLRRQLAFLASGTPLLSVLSGLQNVTLPAFYHYPENSEAITAQAGQWLAAAGFDGDASQLPAYLSPLQQRQLALCRSLMLAPSIVFMDNPLTGLEAEEEQVLVQFLARLKAGGLTLVLASNAAQRLQPLVDEVLFLTADTLLPLAGCQSLWQRSEPAIRAFLHVRGLLGPAASPIESTP